MKVTKITSEPVKHTVELSLGEALDVLEFVQGHAADYTCVGCGVAKLIDFVKDLGYKVEK